MPQTAPTAPPPDEVPAAPSALPTATIAATAALSALPAGLADASAVMGGICFEAALDAAGRVFVLRSAEDHIRFYDLADGSRLCRRRVERRPFDFGEGRALAGLWSAGRGCTARHEVLAFRRDESARVIRLDLRLVVEGACDYELVRPFWVSIAGAADYAVEIAVN
jgi:hypothetical protein